MTLVNICGCQYFYVVNGILMKIWLHNGFFCEGGVTKVSSRMNGMAVPVSPNP